MSQESEVSQLAGVEEGVSPDAITAEIRVEQSLQTVRYPPGGHLRGTVTALLIISPAERCAGQLRRHPAGRSWRLEPPLASDIGGFRPGQVFLDAGTAEGVAFCHAHPDAEVEEGQDGRP